MWPSSPSFLFTEASQCWHATLRSRNCCCCRRRLSKEVVSPAGNDSGVLDDGERAQSTTRMGQLGFRHLHRRRRIERWNGRNCFEIRLEIRSANSNNNDNKTTLQLNFPPVRSCFLLLQLSFFWEMETEFSIRTSRRKNHANGFSIFRVSS